LISGALNSDAFACTVILSLPPLALSTSSANCCRFSVWKLLAGYAAGRSHFVCAAAGPAIESTAAAPQPATSEGRRSNRIMGSPRGTTTGAA
jgi:hypothetical protein